MLKTFFHNPCNIYFSLWCLYLLQGTLYVSGSILSQGFLAIILLMSLKPTLEMFVQKQKLPYFVGLNALLLMYIIYGFFSIVKNGAMVEGVDGHNVPSFLYTKYYMMSLLPIYVCYKYAKVGYLNKKMLQRWVVVFLLVAIAEYFRLERDVLEELAQRGSNAEEITNNMGYVLLSLIPCMLIYDKKPLIKYLGIGVCVIFVIMAMKRGAIFCCALALVLIVWHEMRKAKGFRKMLISIVIVVSVVLLTRFVSNMIESSAYFNSRIEQTLDGDSSYRDSMYVYLWDAFVNETNWWTILFGHGADGTLLTLGEYAHNDWLETLTNQGVVGVVFFFVYWLLFYKTIRNKARSSDNRFLLLFLFCVFGLKTLFSMSIGDMTIYTVSVLGYALADRHEFVGCQGKQLQKIKK